MKYSVSKLTGTPAFTVAKLKAAGIRDSEALLRATHTARSRKALSAKTGFSEQQLLDWAHLSDFTRIPGMGPSKARLFRAAGVSTVRDFRYRNPANLSESLKETNLKYKFVRTLPSPRSIEELIEEARKLDLKITY